MRSSSLSKSKKIILLITILASLFRFYLVIEFPERCCSSDSKTYNDIAKNLVTRNEFVTTKQDDSLNFKDEIYGAKPPLYPFFIAGIYKIFGISPMAVIIAQILLSAVIGYLIFLIAQKAHSTQVGIFSLIVYSFFWETAFMSTTLLAENLYWLLTTFLIYLLIRKKEITFKELALAGVVVGLMTLTRAPSYTILLPILIWFFIKSLDKGIGRFVTSIGYLIVIFLFFALTISPWVFRNYSIYNRFVMVYTDGAINIWMGNYPDSGGSYNLPKANDPNQTPVLHSSGVNQEVERDQFYYNQAILYIKSNPSQALDTALRKIFITFTSYRGYVLNYAYNHRDWILARPKSIGLNAFLEIIVNYQFTALILLFFISIFLILRSSKDFTPTYLLLTILFFWHMLIIAITHSEPRYVTQIYPLIIPLTSLPGYSILKYIKRDYFKKTSS